ncbi:MAG: DUF2269 domain-containing protein [Rickettsiales bacterium]|nr:DUF2269 domain-containing protein [Rickettsiales bacterium]
MDYLLLKWLHILSATILFGTGLGSAFYMFMANRRREPTGMHFAVCHVVIADWLFTTPAVIVQLVTGVGLVHVLGLEFSEPWVFWGAVSLFLCRCLLVAGGMDADSNAGYGQACGGNKHNIARTVLAHGADVGYTWVSGVCRSDRGVRSHGV